MTDPRTVWSVVVRAELERETGLCATDGEVAWALAVRLLDRGPDRVSSRATLAEAVVDSARMDMLVAHPERRRAEGIENLTLAEVEELAAALDAIRGMRAKIAEFSVPRDCS